MSTRPWILDDDVGALIEPLLLRPEKSPGPRALAGRLCLQGILYVLHHDIAWQLLPLELTSRTRSFPPHSAALL
ncbi:transposase [Streptomyces sp. NPDC047043]|uniref:transposase n=1 Tax=Streptomyces sp. NPDC047043 TaxID=3154497 RepID=UPI0033DB6BF2